VLDGRIAPDCEVQMEAVTGQAFVPAGDLELYQSLVKDGAVAWRRAFTSSGPPILTALLIGIQIRIWWWARLPDVADALIENYAKWGPPIYEQGESWRILTMGFVHIDPFHLILNMMWLGYTGWNLERALGRVNLLTLYIASIIGGSILSLIGSPQSMSVGASGGVFGLVAASVVFGFLRPDLTPSKEKSLYGAALLPYLILMLFSGLTNDGTDNWSHVGGLITGGTLAFLLDPDPLQRRPRWNLRVHISTIVISTALLASLFTSGIHLYPLLDSEKVRWETRTGANIAPETDSAISYRVPKAWETGRLVGGNPGFRSPLGGAGFGVLVGLGSAPTTLEDEASKWTQTLLSSYPNATVGEPFATTVAKRPGLGVTAQSESGDTLVEWRGAVQGCWVLEEVWEVSSTRTNALQPLAARLRADVNWSEPTPLTYARIAHEQVPNSLNMRLSLARALGEAGQIDEALPHWKALLSENPDNNFVQSGLLEAIRWYPDSIEETSAFFDTLLAGDSSINTLIELSDTLATLGHPHEATGLLEMLWFEHPGNRTLKRARRTRGLWTSLDSSNNLPYYRLVDLTTLRPLPPVIDPEKTREDLIIWSRSLESMRQGLATQIADNVTSNPTLAIQAMLLLKLGKPPEDVPGAAEGVQEDLLAPDWPKWLLPAREAGASRDQINQSLVIAQANPDILPRFE
jgi:rhomboid protease GluP